MNKNKKKVYVTNWLNQASNHRINEKENKIEMDTNFFYVSNKVPTPYYHFLLRIISFMGGKIILPLLKKYFIHKQQISIEKMNRKNFISIN